jgi:hypothetical protein
MSLEDCTQGLRALELADRTVLPTGPVGQGLRQKVPADNFSSRT